ncbi:hypothetical protein AWENTII_000294 [Aspergillus wentii]
MRTVKNSPSLEGFQSLCTDGVLRSFSGSHAIVDALPLNAEEIQHAVYIFNTACPESQHEEIRKIFDGVDGSKVPQEKILRPDDEVLPEEVRGCPEEKNQG